MDPVTAAATITQLIGLFRQEKGARKDLSHRQFIEWLEYHRHEEIKELIIHTFHLSTQVDEILKQDHKVILARLDDVNRILLDILSRIEGLGGLAVCLVPDIGALGERDWNTPAPCKLGWGNAYSFSRRHANVRRCVFLCSDGEAFPA